MRIGNPDGLFGRRTTQTLMNKKQKIERLFLIKAADANVVRRMYVKTMFDKFKKLNSNHKLSYEYEDEDTRTA